MENRPNIIIVMTDQQRADLRKSCGYELDTMPFLDKWAAGGVDFERAYTPNPTCMPARVSMFTGRYSECHRVRTNHNLADALYTEDLLDVLKASGYRTALCGKNHSHRANEDFDFYEVCGHLGDEGEVNTTLQEKEFAEFLKKTNHLETHEPSPGGFKVQHPFRNVSSAFKFIDEGESKTESRPFFVWLSFAEPHNPYQVPEPYFDMFPPNELPKLHGTSEDLAGKGRRYSWIRGVWERVLGDDIENRIQRSRSNYHGMLRLIDDQFGRLINGLEDRGLDQNTIVIFVSDHGDFVGEYGLIRKGLDLPDILAHIPMIWRGPGIRAQGKKGEVFTGLTDILPTVCDILGAEIPLGCQGKSILPLLKGDPVPEGEFDTAYSESGFSGLFWDEGDQLTPEKEGAVSEEWDRFDCLNTWTQCGQVRALWKGNYHIQLNMMGEGYLYDRKTDPYELSDLWDHALYQEVKTQLLAELAAAMMKAADPLPVPHNRYRTKLHPKGYWKQEYHSPDMGIREMKGIGSRGR
ncbi:sulfatase-like hydrolase/transferase [Lachnospiraceae bacterium 54-53]